MIAPTPALIDRIQHIQQSCQQLIDTADEQQDGLMSDDQLKEFDDLQEKSKQLCAQLDRRQQFAKSQHQLSQSQGLTTPVGSIQNHRLEDPMGGFSDMGDFALRVMQACKPGGLVDERLQFMSGPDNFHRETGSSEGYLVPPAMRREIWSLVFQEDNLLNRVDREPTSSNAVELLRDESTPWGATGIQANWRAEGTQMSPSRLSVEAAMVKLHELYAFVLATDELLDDAPRLNRRLTQGAAEAITWTVNEAILQGTGTGQPLGYLTSKATVTVPKESGQSAASLTPQNLADMYCRLLPSSVSRAIWLANSDILPQLMTMTLGDQPIWTPPATGFKSAPGGFLLGKPLVFSELTEPLGQAGDIQLIDPKGYYLTVKQGGVQFDHSIHLYFDYGIQAFRWTFRLGGQPYLSAPVKRHKSANTLSHFVILADRT